MPKEMESAVVKHEEEKKKNSVDATLFLRGLHENKVPIYKRPELIYEYGLKVEEPIDDQLFKLAYTGKEFSDLRGTRKKRRIFEDGISDTEGILDTMVLFDLREGGLKNLIKKEKDSGKKNKWKRELELLNEKSPSLKTYTEVEHDVAVERGWEGRMDMAWTYYYSWWKEYLNNSAEASEERKSGVRSVFESKWQEDRGKYWEENKEYIGKFLKLDGN